MTQRDVQLTWREAPADDDAAMSDLLSAFPPAPGLRDQLRRPFFGHYYLSQERLVWLVSDGNTAAAGIVAGLTKSEAERVATAVAEAMKRDSARPFSQQLIDECLRATLAVVPPTRH